MSRAIVKSLVGFAALFSSLSAASADPFADALAQCALGLDFDDCIAAMGKVGLDGHVSNRGTIRMVGLSLVTPVGSHGFWEFASPTSPTNPKKNKIILANLRWPALPGPQRRALIDWFDRRLQSATPAGDHWSSGDTCGYQKTGPAWASNGVYDPEIRFALSGVPWLTPPAGKPLEAIFEKTKADEVRICFILPFNMERREHFDPQFTEVYLEFIRTSPLATAVKPLSGRRKPELRPFAAPAAVAH